MELRIHSDTHLEAFIGKPAELLVEKFFPTAEGEFEQTLVLAGDICSVPEKTNEVLQILSRRFANILYVPGNHEYYRSDLDTVNGKLKRIQQNIPNLYISCANKIETVVIDNVRFIFGTLWTDPFAEGFKIENVKYYLNDFRVIRDFTVEVMAEIHFSQKNELQHILSVPFSGETVVVTHHMPSFSLCHPRFGNECNHGFASNCEELLNSGKINTWIFGHTHDRISQQIGSTKLECNPTGYRGEWGNNFSGGQVVVVKI